MLVAILAPSGVGDEVSCSIASETPAAVTREEAKTLGQRMLDSTAISDVFQQCVRSSASDFVLVFTTY
jgi:hypothetical protein